MWVIKRVKMKIEDCGFLPNLMRKTVSFWRPKIAFWGVLGARGAF